MNYTSTRNPKVSLSSAQAIAKGISPDGGLFVPQSVPVFGEGELRELIGLGYRDRAKRILAKYLTDFTGEEIGLCVEGAYAPGKFSSPEVAGLHTLEPGVEILELWRGPTCAFKDMALQLLPRVMTVAAAKTGSTDKIAILVATSGDTGKAALEGFRDVPGTCILVFYPVDGVSAMQKLQMTTQEGSNVSACAIQGNFDDAQNGVKAIFTDKAFEARLAGRGISLSSANSINWGRLVPQIVYYVSAYCDMVAKGTVALGDSINIVVPTGNFGNILAAYYAGLMGIPVHRFVCASNSNNVLTEFLQTGRYNRNRAFYTTSSPSMDILISSNLERLLYLLGEGDTLRVSQWMAELAATGGYDVGREMTRKISELFSAGFCDDKGTAQTIRETFETRGYLCDTHTAVALNVYMNYRKESGDVTPALVASTANPFKFCESVLSALRPELAAGSEFEMIEALESFSGIDCPPQLLNLRGKTERFTGSCSVAEMPGVVGQFLQIG